MMMNLFKFIKILLKKFVSKIERIRSERKYGPYPKYFFNKKNIHIEKYTFGWPNILFSEGENELYIGNFCSIAEGVTIMMGGRHHGEWISTYPFYHQFPGLYKWNFPEGSTGKWGDIPQQNTKIGHDVWLGRDVLVLPGVTIGNGAIIGARAVVSKDIPPYAIAVGAPARVVRKRWSDDQIESLEKIQWWNWSPERMEQELPYICSHDIEEFIRRNS